MSNFSIQEDIERKYAFCAALLIVEKGTKLLQDFLIRQWDVIDIEVKKPANGRPRAINWASFKPGRDILDYEDKNTTPATSVLYRHLNRTQIYHLKNYTLREWDISLLSSVLLNSAVILKLQNIIYPIRPQKNNSTLKDDISRLRNLRNDEYGHISEMRMTEKSFKYFSVQFKDICDDLIISLDDKKDIQELTTATLKDDEIATRKAKVENELNSLLYDFSQNRMMRLNQWLEKFCLYEDRVLAETLRLQNRVEVQDPLIAPLDPRKNPSTISALVSATTLNSTTNLGGKQFILGALILHLYPENITLPVISSTVEVIIGSRSLLQYKYEIPSDMRNYDPIPLIEKGVISAQKWLIGLDKDGGLNENEICIKYDAMIPGWIVERTSTAANKVYLLNGGGSEQSRLIEPNEFTQISLHDKIMFGEKFEPKKYKKYSSENHVLQVMSCKNDSRDDFLPIDGLLTNCISNHEFVGQTYTKKKKVYAYPAKRGGFAMIFKVKYHSDDQSQIQESPKFYALKCPFRKNYLEFLEKEIKILATLGGFRSIISIRDMFFLKENKNKKGKAKINIPVFKLDWAEFGSLADCLENQILFDDAYLKQFSGVDRENRCLLRSLDILVQIAEALEYAHSKDVTHADLKPANVLIMGYRRNNLSFFDVAICDFNISSSFDLGLQKNGAGINFYDSCGSSKIYRAPEQSSRVSKMTGIIFESKFPDIWSLGVVMIQLLSKNRFLLKDIEDICCTSESLASIEAAEASLKPHKRRILHDCLDQILSEFNSGIILPDGNLHFLFNSIGQMLTVQPKLRPPASVAVNAIRKLGGRAIISAVRSSELKKFNRISYDFTSKYLVKMSSSELLESFSKQLLRSSRTESEESDEEEEEESPASQEFPPPRKLEVLLNYVEKVLFVNLPIRVEEFVSLINQLCHLFSDAIFKKLFKKYFYKKPDIANALEEKLTRFEGIKSFYEQILSMRSYPNISFSFVDKLTCLNYFAYKEINELIQNKMNNQFIPQYHKKGGIRRFNFKTNNFAMAISFFSRLHPVADYCEILSFQKGSFSFHQLPEEGGLMASNTADVCWFFPSKDIFLDNDLQHLIKEHESRYQQLLQDHILSQLSVIIEHSKEEDKQTHEQLEQIIINAIENHISPEFLLNSLLSKQEIQSLITRSSLKENTMKGTLLHVILSAHYPAAETDLVVRELLRLVPPDSLLSALDEDGQPPLAIACRAPRQCISFDLLLDLIRLYPTAATIRLNEGEYCIHRYLRNRDCFKLDDVLSSLFDVSESLVASSGNIKFPSLLHFALLSPAIELEVLQKILSFYPPSIYQFGGFDDLPLSYAAYKSGKVEIIEHLLNHYPKTTLTINGKNIDFSQHRGGCVIYDRNGNLPVHSAIQNPKVSIDTIRSLLKHYPEAVFWLNFEDESPLSLAEKRFQKISFIEKIDDKLLKECQKLIEFIQRRIDRFIDKKEEIREFIYLTNESWKYGNSFVDFNSSTQLNEKDTNLDKNNNLVSVLDDSVDVSQIKIDDHQPPSVGERKIDEGKSSPTVGHNEPSSMKKTNSVAPKINDNDRKKENKNEKVIIEAENLSKKAVVAPIIPSTLKNNLNDETKVEAKTEVDDNPWQEVAVTKKKNKNKASGSKGPTGKR